MLYNNRYEYNALLRVPKGCITMSFVKKVSALLVALCMLFSFAACHSKNETVVTVDGVEIGSGLYILYMLNATESFKSAYQETLGENDTAPETLEEYLEKTVDKKDAVTWIKDKTVEFLKEYVWTTKTFEKYKLNLDNYEGGAEYYVSYYWDQYGYGTYYENNGVSRDTLLKFYETMFKEQAIFDYLYGEGGPSEVPADDVYKEFTDTYVNVEYFEASYVDNSNSEEQVALSDEEKAKIKTQLEPFVEQINNEELTVKEAGEVYDKLVNPEEEKEETDSSSTSSAATSSDATSSTDSSDSTSSGATSSEEEEKIKQVYADASLVYEEDSTGLYAHVKDVKEYDKAVIYDDKDNMRFVVALVRDPKTDYEYYKESYLSDLLHSLRDDAFEKVIEDGVADMKVEKVDSLVKFYSPKKIKEEE